MIPAEVILKKRRGHELSQNEIKDFVLGFTEGQIPDYQMSALLMAICFRSLTKKETDDLTSVIIASGKKFDWPEGPTVLDKHSTGGVGDKTSLILAPLLGSMGYRIPMIAGRGLGHTGGTLDKLESIPGFKVQFSVDEFRTQVEKLGFGIGGQSQEICPADKKLYALRDVTSTVDCIPLICASIMSKKMAEGLDALVLDVKFGSGAFMKTREQAKDLALELTRIGKAQGVPTTALLTSMEQPLGRYSGNSLEVIECIDILKNEKFIYDGKDLYEDTRELTLALAAEMALSTGNFSDLAEARAKVESKLADGSAFESFQKMCLTQGAKDHQPQSPSNFELEVKSPADGFLSEIQTEKVGLGLISLGAGRRKVTDQIEPGAGAEFLKKVSDSVKKNETLIRLFANSDEKLKEAKTFFFEALKVSEEPVKAPELISETLRPNE